MKGKKMLRVVDVRVTRFPWQLIFVMVLSIKFCQKNDQSSNDCHIFRITVKALQLLGEIFQVIYFSDN